MSRDDETLLGALEVAFDKRAEFDELLSLA